MWAASMCATRKMELKRNRLILSTKGAHLEWRIWVRMEERIRKRGWERKSQDFFTSLLLLASFVWWNTVHVVVFNTSTRATMLTLNALKCFFFHLSLTYSLALCRTKWEIFSLKIYHMLFFPNVTYSLTACASCERIIHKKFRRAHSIRESERASTCFFYGSILIAALCDRNEREKMPQDTFNFDISIRQDYIPVRERITSAACSVFVCKWFFN